MARSQAQRGKRVKQKNPFGPGGISMMTSEVIYDTFQYGDGASEAMNQKTSLFNEKDRIGADKWFLCNLSKPGELPYGSSREVFGLSLFAQFRDAAAPTDGLATAEELYDLVMAWTYVEIVKNNKDVIAKIPTSLIPQFNGVQGTGGALGAPKYTLGKGMLKLDERILLEAGEQFEAIFAWTDLGRTTVDPRTRYNLSVEAQKFLRLHLHTVAFDRPSIS